MIKALPYLVKKYPNILYTIIGETHPAIRKKEGEEYRNSLIDLVKKLGLQENVKFYNKYLDLDEIIEYLLASDIYICTNLERNQIVSGTLSYAMDAERQLFQLQTYMRKKFYPMKEEYLQISKIQNLSQLQ